MSRSLSHLLRAVGIPRKTGTGSWWNRCATVRQLAEQQSALRRVATLVAGGSSPSVIFEAAAGAVGTLIKADYTAINRCETDGTMSVISLWRAVGLPDIGLPFGGRWSPGDDTPSAAVLRTHKPSRRASAPIGSDIGGWLRENRIGHALACPVIVDDRLWGTMTALYLGAKPPPDDTEERMGEFVDLLHCAIVQAETRAELITVRGRLVTCTDAVRRRIERDLHDGAQQHLISLALRLREAETNVAAGNEVLTGLLSDTVDGLTTIVTELQETVRGLHPPALARRGLQAALTSLVSRFPAPVDLHVQPDERLPEDVEVTLYYVVSEALTNVLKHAHASAVCIALEHQDSKVRLTVQDNGVGGADPAQGSGLAGLKDRVEALGGVLRITSLAGEGTSLIVTVPVCPA